MKERTMLTVGYKAFTGRVFNRMDCESYNRIQKEINTWIKAEREVPEALLNASHRMFVSIANRV